jgi:hypothetical protein
MSYTSSDDLIIKANDGYNIINCICSSFQMNNKDCFTGGSNETTSYTPFDYSNETVDQSFNYYYLPYSQNNRILIQFGQVKDEAANTQVYFPKSFSGNPYIFLQQFSNNGDYSTPRIMTVTTSYFTADPYYSQENKGPYTFFAIGISD